ncbi:MULTISPECIES: type II toxin-antitoxin system prevent-host-death family antitoxin [unclassified Streptomyces]|uniref:type II toxin-antitoxin system Phd/YefM family antitoxin n=1 Tax=unclassified Streptomyces TaxID=2593676 RepID=UPI0005F926F0|nr:MULTISPECIES: type II toxin-antitoxin system prevent-host-death family antitoxin [unclassified Streptomyces]KJY32568.1 prevent-host-death protein [Streptomyces sp. NRRL S-495]KOV09511.1 prevent-host-death protein [Streptomyces sp. XY431]
MAESLSIREARAHLAEVVTKAESGEITVITRKGERVGAVVPIEILDAIEEAADELAAREAELHRNDPTVSMAELLADLFDAPPDSAGSAA